MSHDNPWVKGVVSAILITSAAASTSTSMAEAAATPNSEKCFNISKKGMNDCATPNHSCQGQSTKDSDPKEFLYVLEGTCNKIVGGMLQKE